MRFVDRTLLRLADADEIAALITPTVGGALLSAAYVFDEVAVGDVTAARVRAVTLTPVVPAARTLTATVRETTSPASWQASADLPPIPSAAGHAVLEVDLTASARGVVSEVVDVATADLSALADLSAIDAGIIAADGALPADPNALATRRHDALLAAIADRFTETDPAGLRAALAGRGITTLDRLMASLTAPHAVERLALTIVTDSTAPARARTFRVKAIVEIVEDLATGLASALSEISVARFALAAGADPQPAPPGMSPRLEYPALLVMPQGGLDDDDLPLGRGPAPADAAGRRAARLAELTTRLRSVAVVPVAV